jgi:chromatin structure-remodeling complex subunit RSC1/2
MARQQVERETAEAQSQQLKAEEPVQSIEDDGNSDQKENALGDGKPSQARDATSDVTDDQWRSMTDVVMAIYEYREEEYVLRSLLQNTRVYAF